MTLVVTHTTVTGAAADSTALVDGPAWDANHTLAGQASLSQGGTGSDLSGTGGAGQVLKQASAGGVVTVGTIPASDIASGAALTKVDDTNVTLTLGGTPTTALLKASSITVGWTGTLAASRGGFGADVSAQSGVPLFATGVATFTSTTGSGNFVRATSPTLVTPALGTPTSGTLTSCTAFTLTTTGSSGAATYSAGTLNVPNYGAVGVSTIAGNSGAFTLANGLSNSTNILSQLSKGSNILEANGGCEVWQIGTAPAIAASTTAHCGPDRWYLTTGATQASVVSRQAGIVTGSRYCANVKRNSGQTGTAVMKFAYPLITDEATRCQSQLLALSFTAKADSSFSPTSGTLTYNVYFGTGAAAKRGGGFTSESNPITGSVNLTTTASQTIAIASGAAGAAVTQGEVLFTWTPVGTAGAGDAFYIDDVRLDIIPSGTSAFSPPVEHLDHGAYFLQCRQVYRQSYVEGTAPGTVTSTGRIAYVAAGTGGEALPAYPYNPTMWTTPSPTTLYSPDTGASGNNRNATGAADVAGTLVTVTGDGHASFSVAHTSGNVYWYHYIADARL